MLSCITPHVGEEIWQLLGHGDTIAYEAWPSYDEEKCREGLNAAAGMLRSLIYKKLTIHTVPTLHFVLDESVARGFAMDRVIEEAMQETRRNEASEGKTE